MVKFQHKEKEGNLNMCFVKKNLKTHHPFFLIFVIAVFITMVVADGIQRDFGKIKVSVGTPFNNLQNHGRRRKDWRNWLQVVCSGRPRPQRTNPERYYSSTAIRTIGKLAAYALELARRGVVVFFD